MDAEAIKNHLTVTLLNRLADTDSRRKEALQEFMGVAMPTVDGQAAERVSSLVPEIPMPVYAKWVNLFADSMLATIPKEQLCALCEKSEENDATIALIYVMFMESERMEKQIAEDLHTLGIELAEDDVTGTALGNYLRNKLAMQKETSSSKTTH